MHRTPPVPVLFTSGHTRDILSSNHLLSPDIHLLSKPYSPEALTLRVRSVLTATIRLTMTSQRNIPAITAQRPGFVRVRGAREHNLQNVDVDIPGMPWWCLPACRVRASRPWRFPRCMPRPSGATSNRWRLTRGA